MLWVINWYLILFNIYCGIYSIPKQSKFTVVFLPINNETQCIPLLYLSSRFMAFAPSFILDKLSLEKTPLNLDSKLKDLVISILPKWWSGSKKFYLYDPWYFFLVIVTLFPTLVVLFPRTFINIGNACNIFSYSNGSFSRHSIYK